MISTVLSLERYKKLRVKYATQIEDGMFDPNGFIEDMKPFFDDRERKYLAYTSEKNEIDNRPKPNTDIVKVNNKLHAGMYSIVVDQAVNHFTGIPIKWDYDVSEQKRTLIQRLKDKFLKNDTELPTVPEVFNKLTSNLDSMRFAMLDPETATFQGACGVAFRLLEPVEGDDGWELRASNIEPWRAERYGNAGIYIKEKYDSYQKKFFQEMKVITRNEITTYACYGDLDFITNGTFKKIDETKNPLEVINLSEFKNNTNRYCDFEVAEEIGDAIDRASTTNLPENQECSGTELFYK